MALIYGLVHDEEIRYVGKTTMPLEKRFGCHLKHAREGKPWYVSRWIRSVDYDVTVEILEVDPADIDQAERDWIRVLGLLGSRLTNCTPGGEGSAGYRWTDEQRAAHRERMKEINARPEKRNASAKGGKAQIGRSRSPAHRAAISRTLTGRKNGPLSTETRDKIGHANTGSKCSCRASRPCAFCRRGGGA